MKLAFCLFKYFPFGGLQRDFMRIAAACSQRGHAVHVYAMEWQGEVPDWLQLQLLPGKGVGNPGRCRDFARQVGERLAGQGFHAVVGFNKMPGLDVYFAADPCFVAKARKKHGPLYRLGRRYRIYAEMERAVFGADAATEILLISDVERSNFVTHYSTPERRFHFLPPGIDRDRIATDDGGRMREEFRQEFGLTPAERVVLMIGSGYKTKGLDRAIRALAALPPEVRQQTTLLVVGQGKAAPFLRLAAKLGVADRVCIVGGRSDVPRFLFGADLLLHPAYYENTGTVLVEALAAGLPVLASAVCGYAHYVEESGAGLLVPSPFRQEVLDALLERMLQSPDRQNWRRRGLDFAARADIFSLPERATDIIEAKSACRSTM